MSLRVAVALVLVVGLANAAPAPAPAAGRSVPQGFLGAVADGPLVGDGAFRDPRVDLRAELALMARSGVETIRSPILWSAAQPYPSRAALPPAASGRPWVDVGGVPTDFSAIDRVVGLAAAQGLRVQPVVILAPAWARQTPFMWSPPRRPEAYGRFLGALARRYGTRGSFWRAGRRRLPVGTWQIANEPNDRYFWSRDGSTTAPLRDYVALLRASRRALRAADPRARVLLAGLVKRSWEALERIYRLGGRRLFDAVALHPFTGSVEDEIAIVRLNRRVMARHGDRRKPIQLTEASWPSARGRTTIRYGYEETEAGQARRLRSHFVVLSRLRRRLGIERLFWYTWLTADAADDFPFDYAGLRALPPAARVPRSKPALHAFTALARRLEGCRKSSVATRCR